MSTASIPHPTRPFRAVLGALSVLVALATSANGAQVIVPPVTITQLTHTLDAGHQWWNRDAVFIGGHVGYTSDGFRSTLSQGDVIQVSIQAPTGKRFVLHALHPGYGGTKLGFDLEWSTGGQDALSQVSPHVVTFEGLVGPVPTEEYSLVGVGDARNTITVWKYYRSYSEISFTGIRIALTLGHSPTPTVRTFGPVLSSSSPGFSGFSYSSAQVTPILELVDEATVPANETSWGRLKALYR